MVARGMVREAHASLEAQQVRLKEIRDRLDRVSREEAHYLELATMEHRLLQVSWTWLIVGRFEVGAAEKLKVRLLCVWDH